LSPLLTRIIKLVKWEREKPRVSSYANKAPGNQEREPKSTLRMIHMFGWPRRQMEMKRLPAFNPGGEFHECVTGNRQQWCEQKETSA